MNEQDIVNKLKSDPRAWVKQRARLPPVTRQL